MVNFQTVEGPQGLPGEDGRDGQDAPGGLVVGILNPDDNEVVSGNVSIRALIYGSNDFIISVFRNGSEIGNVLPLVWDTTLELKGWYNITVIITDIQSLNSTSDEVMVFVDNSPDYGSHNTFYWFDTSDTSVLVLSSHQSVMLSWFVVRIYVESGEHIHLTFSCEVVTDYNLTLSYGFFRYPDIEIGQAVTIDHIASIYDTIYIESVINAGSWGMIPGEYWIDVHVLLIVGPSVYVHYSDKTLIASTFIPGPYS